MSFHPDRSLVLTRITEGRLASDFTFGNNGAFTMASRELGWQLFIIASDGGGWDHVSVHARRNGKFRVPNWREMCAVKDACWDENDVVVQFHPRKRDYVNNHPYVLHLWRYQGAFPTPDPGMVGVQALGQLVP